MDSKSISREGSRGSSPRPGTTALPAADEAATPLARALLPVLLHELAGHTQFLAASNALMKSGGECPDEAALGRTADEVEELGWLLGLCAAGLGFDLLRARRRAGGLCALVRCVRQALRRERRDLAEPDEPLAGIDVGLSARSILGAGELLYAAGCSAPPGSALPWKAARTARGLEVSVLAPAGAGFAAWIGRHGGALDRDGDRTRAVFPLEADR